MGVDTATIRAKLEGLHNLPTPVRAWRIEEGLDATGLWAYVLVRGADEAEAAA